MSSQALSWMMRLRLSWARWSRTRKLKRLDRLARRAQALTVLREQTMARMVAIEEELHPLREVFLPEPLPQLENETPISEMTPPQLEVRGPRLTEEEREQLKAMKMPDPVTELEHRLGLSTMPPSPPTSAG